MPSYFTNASFKFLRALARHNEREWFHAHKADYEAHVRQPYQRLLTDLQPALALISPHYRADPKPVSGSLFRIHRDTRFAHDKSPYKSWRGARLFHSRAHGSARERARQLPAPSFYLHLQPDHCFIGAGLWRLDSAALRRVRQFILDNPAAWKAAAHPDTPRRRFKLDDSQKLVRMPRGFPDDSRFAEDLRLKNFVASRAIEDATMRGPRLRTVLETDLAALAPLVDYLCAALDLEF